MKAVLLKCKPGAQFHLGHVGPDVNTALNGTSSIIHSDTLFSALVNIVAIASPEHLEDFVQAFCVGKDIRISSAFYCMEEAGERVYFLPKPAHYDQYPVIHDPKRFSDIRFVSLGVWDSGALPKDWVKPEFRVLQNQFVVTRAELSDGAFSAQSKLRIYHQQLLPRVDARKPDPTESHFYSANIQIADNRLLRNEDDEILVGELFIHFYFLIESSLEFELTNASKALNLAIQLLPDFGVGGERSVGCGKFEAVELLDFPELRKGKKNSFFATVSLCSPSSDMELEGFHSYETLLRGGRITTQDGTLQLVRMLAEGAVSANKAEGSVPNISPKGSVTRTPYLRLGKPVCLPVTF